MTEKDMAVEIGKRFVEMEHENRALRVVLSRFWNRADRWEDYLQTGSQQLQVRETADRGEQYLESAFDGANDDAALLRILYGQTLGRVKV